MKYIFVINLFEDININTINCSTGQTNLSPDFIIVQRVYLSTTTGTAEKKRWKYINSVDLPTVKKIVLTYRISFPFFANYTHYRHKARHVQCIVTPNAIPIAQRSFQGFVCVGVSLYTALDQLLDHWSIF